ncbi:MAG TPA: hypothetical protein VGJ91_21135, partial [Polyangiaceae bacterium]
AEQCPSGRELTHEIERRIGRPVFDDQGARSFEVQVDREAGNYHSRVYVRGADGQSLGRRALESSDASCAPIFQATVLAIALVIDPDAALPERAGAVATFAPLASEGATPPPASSALPLSATARAPSATPATRDTPPPEQRHTKTELSARALLSTAIVPGTSPGLALHFSARPAERWGVAVGAVYLAPGRALTRAGEVWVGLTSATLGVTFEVAAAQQIRLVLEAGAWAGVLQSSVLRPTPNGSGPFPFLALNAGAHVELQLSRAVFAEIGAVGLVPLLRRELLVAPLGQPLWQEPVLGGLGFLGLGASFP